MKFFILQNPEGKFLDTSYGGRYTRGIWVDKARLYKSKRGLRSGYARTSPAFEKVIGKEPEVTLRPNGHGWSSEYFDALHARRRAINAIPLDQYFELLAEDGYVLKEVEVDL